MNHHFRAKNLLHAPWKGSSRGKSYHYTQRAAGWEYSKDVTKHVRIAITEKKNWSKQPTFLWMYYQLTYKHRGSWRTRNETEDIYRERLSQQEEDQETRSRDSQSKLRMKEHSDQYTNARKSSIRKGDAVVVRQEKKEQTLFFFARYTVRSLTDKNRTVKGKQDSKGKTGQ